MDTLRLVHPASCRGLETPRNGRGPVPILLGACFALPSRRRLFADSFSWFEKFFSRSPCFIPKAT